MIGFIKNLFGRGRQRRSESAKCNSKLKEQTTENITKAPSLDSKPKILETEQKPKEKCESLFEMDEVGTVKHSSRCRSNEYPMKEIPNYDMVSDIDDEQSFKEQYDLLANYPSENNNPFDSIKPDRNASSLIPQKIYTFGSAKSKKLEANQTDHRVITVKKETEAKSTLELGKVFVKRERTYRRPLKVTSQCPFCQEPLEVQGSFKLACAHRFHQKCAMKMKQRNRFQCDLCEIKRKNLCSIILMDRKKNRGPTLINKH